MTNALNTKSAHTSSPVSELVERLQHRAIEYGEAILIDDDLAEAADRLTALEAENAKLREALIYAVASAESFTVKQLETCLSRIENVAKNAITAPQGGNHGE